MFYVYEHCRVMGMRESAEKTLTFWVGTTFGLVLWRQAGTITKVIPDDMALGGFGTDKKFTPFSGLRDGRIIRNNRMNLPLLWKWSKDKFSCVLW